MDGRISVRASGLLSHLPSAKSSLKMLDCQVPAHVGEQLYLSTWLPPVPSRAFDRLAASRMRAGLGWRTPDQITISILEDCPNRCLHCALPDSGRGLRLSPTQVQVIVDQALDMGTTLVIFDGGEPSLYDDLPTLVRGVGDRAISTMFTSGAGFSLELACRLKEAGLQAVNVSLDSPIPQEHDAMRGRKGAFADAMSAAESAISAGLLLDIYVVARRENLRHLAAFHALAARQGAHELTFFEVVPTGRFYGAVDEVLQPEDHDELHRFVAGAGAPRIFSVPEAYRHFGCFAGRTWLHVAPDGDVYPCACLPNSFGNVFYEPLADIWKRMGRVGGGICPGRKAPDSSF